jgi:hypothetical protein
MKTKDIKIYCLLLSALVFMGCKHKDLVYGDALKLTVKFDWSESRTGTQKAESMWVYLYDAAGYLVTYYQIMNNEGETIEVIAGEYRMLCLNADTERIYYRGGDRLETFDIYTGKSSLFAGPMASFASPPMGSATEDPVVSVPDMVWSAQLDGVVSVFEDTEVVFTPRRRVSTVRYTITNVDNLKLATGISGSITGMAGSYNLGLEKPMPPPHTVPFDNPTIDTDNRVISGEFYCFGAWTEQQVHMFYLYAVMADGKKYYYSFDVTEDVKAAEGGIYIDIRIDNLSLPEPLPDDGMIDPDIDDWDKIEVELPM